MSPEVAIAGTAADGGNGHLLAHEEVGEPPERLGRLGLRPGDDDRDSLVDRARDLAVGGDEDVGRAPEHRFHVRLADPDAAVRAVEQQVDVVGVVLHELERLEAELRVLERQGVEHPDHDDVRRVVDRRDDLGREARRRVDDDPVVVLAQDRVDLAQELGADGARLVGAARGDEGVDARRVVRHERLELVPVEDAGRLGEVVDRLLRRQAEAQGHVAELEVEVDERDLLAALREADGEVRRAQRLARAALRPEDADQPRVLVHCGLIRALLAGHELVDLEADLLRRRREHDDVVCAGLERAPEEAVGRPVPEHHHVQPGVLAGHSVEEQQGAVRVAGAGDEEQVGDAAAQPRQRLFGAGDDTDDVEVLAARQRVLHVLGVDTRLDSEKCLYRAARHRFPSRSFLPQHRSCICSRRLRRLRADDRAEDEDQLRVVGRVEPTWTPRRSRCGARGSSHRSGRALLES